MGLTAGCAVTRLLRMPYLSLVSATGGDPEPEWVRVQHELKALAQRIRSKL